MARWIDADDAITRIRKLWNKEESLEEAYSHDDYAFGLLDAKDAVEDSPDIDIVRCQDCKHWVYNFNGCSRNPCTEPWYATDFCNYGERRETNTDCQWK